MHQRGRLVDQNDSILRTKATRVLSNEEARELSKVMISTCIEFGGIGLAAPQIGESVRLIVISTKPAGSWIVLSDPRIIECSGSVKSKEGCLSIPGVTIEVERKTRIKVDAVCLRYGLTEPPLSPEGKRSKLTLVGMLAIIAQHEIDHLDGILIDKYTNEDTSTPSASS